MGISKERLFFKKNKRVANVNNRFLKGVTQNHCMGFLSCTIKRFKANQVESMTIFTQISAALELVPLRAPL